MPNPRVRGGQRACSKTCTATLRKRTQAAWREDHPDYGAAWRITKRAEDPRSEALRMPAPLNRLPWDVAKDAIGQEGTDFIGILGRLIVGVAKDAIRA